MKQSHIFQKLFVEKPQQMITGLTVDNIIRTSCLGEEFLTYSIEWAPLKDELPATGQKLRESNSAILEGKSY